MNRDLPELVHAAYIQAIELVASALPAAATARVGGWFLYDAGVDNPAFNLAAVEPGATRADQHIEDVRLWFRDRRAGFGFRLRTRADAALIATISAGQPPGEVEPYLVRGGAPGRSQAPAHVEVRRVTDREGVDAFDSLDRERARDIESSVAATSLQLADCQLWVAYEDGIAAGRSMAVTTTPVATIHNVLVTERRRRRGLGHAVTAAAIEGCLARGAEYVALGSSAMGLGLYRSMGFELVHDLATFEPTS